MFIDELFGNRKQSMPSLLQLYLLHQYLFSEDYDSDAIIYDLSDENASNIVNSPIPPMMTILSISLKILWLMQVCLISMRFVLWMFVPFDYTKFLELVITGSFIPDSIFYWDYFKNINESNYDLDIDEFLRNEQLYPQHHIYHQNTKI